jgi:hypothetical protein
MTDFDSPATPAATTVAPASDAAPPTTDNAPDDATDDATDDGGRKEQLPTKPKADPGESGLAESDLAGTGTGTGTGTGAGRSEAPRTVIGAQESAAINANLAGLAAGTVRLGS